MLLFIVLVLSYQFLVQGRSPKPFKPAATAPRAPLKRRQALALAEARGGRVRREAAPRPGRGLQLREARVRQWNAERDAALDAARKAARSIVSSQGGARSRGSAGKTAIQAPR